MNPAQHQPRLEDRFLTRRDFLGRCGMGFGLVGLTNLLGPEMLSPALNEITSPFLIAFKVPNKLTNFQQSFLERFLQSCFGNHSIDDASNEEKT